MALRTDLTESGAGRFTLWNGELFGIVGEQV